MPNWIWRRSSETPVTCPNNGLAASVFTHFDEAEQEAWDRKPRLPRRTRALTGQPIVRYLGRDSVEDTVEGWRPWTEVVAGWLREGRSPTVFLHTPDNHDAPALARRFHDDVRALVPGLDALPEPEPVEPATLF